MSRMHWTDIYQNDFLKNLLIELRIIRNKIYQYQNMIYYTSVLDKDLILLRTIRPFPWGHIIYIILFCWKPYIFLGVVYIYARKSNTDLNNLSSSNIGKRIHSVSNSI